MGTTNSRDAANKTNMPELAELLCFPGGRKKELKKLPMTDREQLQHFIKMRDAAPPGDIRFDVANANIVVFVEENFDLFADAEETEQQRDKLLAACKRAEQFLSDTTPTDCSGILGLLHALLAECEPENAAWNIAKAKTEKAS